MKRAERFRVGIFGAGLMGHWHAVYARRTGAKVVAVIDRDAERARELAARAGGALALTPDERRLEELELDSVHVCSPLETHARLAEDALLAGRHVVVEKPAAPDLRQTRRLVDLARERGLYLTPVHQFPFQRGFRRLLRNVGKLGELRSATYRTFTAGAEGRGEARRRQVLLEILPHAVSLFHGLGTAELDPGWSLERFDADRLELRGETGSVGLEIRMSLSARPPRNELVVAGTGGTALVDLYHGFCVFEYGRPGRSGKLLRPLVNSARLLFAATGNLVLRTALRQPAYPGLPELIGQHYRAIASAAPPVVAAKEMLAAAALRELVEARRPRPVPPASATA